ncbi:Lysophospholipase L1 [Desulfonatronum zhilinae]|nr:Lysophospholipase L1 [Desulfonatronum zhilinae]
MTAVSVPRGPFAKGQNPGTASAMYPESPFSAPLYCSTENTVMHRMIIAVLGIFTLLLALAVQPAFAFEDLLSKRATTPQRESVPAHDFGDNDPNVIVALGDSITAGYPFVTQEETYPAQLQALIGRTVVNGGSGGARAYHGVQVTDYFLRRFKPGYVLIMYGANDVMERSAHTIANDLLTIARKATENKSIPVMSTITPVDGPKIGRKNAILNLNEVIKARAAEFGYLVADVAPVLGWEGQYLLPDGLHPNSAGMEIIAQTFYEKILEAENENGGGGGGGCTIAAHDRLTGDWLILLAALSVLFFLGRRGRNTCPAKSAEVFTGQAQ